MRRRSDQRGNILFLTAGSMTFMIGVSALVVDVGLALEARTRMQAAMDAAALAGAFQTGKKPLDAFAVKNATSATAQDNGFTVAPDAITLGADPVQGRPSVTVRHQADVSTLFARLFGVPTFRVTASAATTTAPLTEIPLYPMPFALPAERAADGTWRILSTPTPVEYREMQLEPPTGLFLKVSEGGSMGGNFLTLGVDGSGTNDIVRMIDKGVQTRLKVGDTVQTRTGEVTGPIEKAVDNRVLQGRTDITILLIPRAEWEALQGPSPVTVIGFVCAKLLGVQADGTIACEFNEQILPRRARVGSQVGAGGYGPVLIPPGP